MKVLLAAGLSRLPARWTRKLVRGFSPPSSRKILVPVAGLALAAVVSFSCSRAESPQQHPIVIQSAPYQRPIVDRTKPVRMATAVPLDDGRKIIDAVYRLRPDRRFVNAAADIVEVAGGERQVSVQIDFAGGEWRVSVGGAEAIRLPEIATFGVALNELTRWAAKQPRRGEPASSQSVLGEVDALLARGEPSQLFSALARLDGAAAGKPFDAAAIQRAAHAATRLAANANDPFDISDTLHARALAILAMARALDANCCNEDVSLLAHVSGYISEAAKLGARPDEDKHEPDDDPLPGDFPRALAAFELRIEQDVSKSATRLLDDRSIRSFHEAQWYPLLHRRYVQHHQMARPDEIEKLMKSLHPRSAIGAQAIALLSQLSAAKNGQFERAVPPSYWVRDATLLGGSAKYDLFDSIRFGLGDDHPQVHAAARELAMVLDSRPKETRFASRVADAVGHVRNREVYMQSGIERGPSEHSGDTAEFLSSVGEDGRLRDLLRGKNASLHDRLDAIHYLSGTGAEDLHTDFERVIAAAGYDPNHLQVYLDYLDKRNEPAIKERFIRTVIARNADLDPIGMANVVSYLVNALDRQGRYQEAWELAEPHIPVFSARIVSATISVLHHLGRYEETIKLGQSMVERYPTAKWEAHYALVLWRMRRHDQAAALFDPDRAEAVELDTFVPAKFCEAFDDSSITSALVAYEALIRRKMPVGTLGYFPAEAARLKQWKLTLALVERYLKVPYTPNESYWQESHLTGYKAVRELEGDGAASRWFIDRIPPQKEADVMLYLVVQNETDLLTYLSTARKASGPNLWMSALLAAALKVDRVPLDDARWDAVRSLLPLAPSGGADLTLHTSVRYLLGEEKASAVDADPWPASRAIAAYYLGIYAAAGGRYDEALRDLLVATEGPPLEAAATMASWQLNTWRQQRMRWDVLARGAVPKRQSAARSH